MTSLATRANIGNPRQILVTEEERTCPQRTSLYRVLAIIRDVLANNPRVLKDPAPGVGISALADSAITVAIQPWVAVADYGDAQAEIYRAVVARFREGRIEIPFPQREVRLLPAA